MKFGVSRYPASQPLFFALSSCLVATAPGFVLAPSPPQDLPVPSSLATSVSFSPSPVRSSAYPKISSVEHWVTLYRKPLPQKRSTVPKRATVQKPTPQSTAAPPSSAKVYRIQWGDTLWSLSRRFHVSIKDLQVANGLGSTTTIVAGRELVVPVVYTVQSGDTPEGLATRFGVSIPAIQRENGLSQGVRLTPGVRLVMPPTSDAALLPSEPRPALNARGVPSTATVTANDVVLLAHLVQAEAGNQPFIGQVAVANVVLHRIESPEFPNTLEGVIFQSGQFDSVRNGTFWNPPSPEAFNAVQTALEGLDPVPGALYFYNPNLTQESWIRAQPVVGAIAGQVFAR